MPTRHITVFADSLAYHGPSEAVPPDDPRLWPNLGARKLPGDWQVDLFARPGWTARDGWWALTKDPRAWGQALPRASAVVLALGQMDQLPAAVPTWLRESIPYLRPARLRGVVRDGYRRVAPPIIRATDGRLTQLSIPATSHYLARMVQGIRHFRPDVTIVRLNPAPYDARIYPAQRQHSAAVAAAEAWSERLTVPGIDLDAIVGPHLRAGRNNPDGMHWGWQCHAEIGEAVADRIAVDLDLPHAPDRSQPPTRETA